MGDAAAAVRAGKAGGCRRGMGVWACERECVSEGRWQVETSALLCVPGLRFGACNSNRNSNSTSNGDRRTLQRFKSQCLVPRRLLARHDKTRRDETRRDERKSNTRQRSAAHHSSAKHSDACRLMLEPAGSATPTKERLTSLPLPLPLASLRTSVSVSVSVSVRVCRAREPRAASCELDTLARLATREAKRGEGWGR